MGGSYGSPPIPTNNLIVYNQTVVNQTSTAIAWSAAAPTVTTSQLSIVTSSNPDAGTNPMEYHIMVEVTKGSLLSITDNATTPNTITFTY